MEESMAESLALGEYLLVDTDNHAISFVGADVYIQNGSDETAVEGDMGGGNLIIGYDGGDAAGKIGWHNMVVGDGHSYTDYGTSFSHHANVDNLKATSVEAEHVDTVSLNASLILAETVEAFEVRAHRVVADIVFVSDFLLMP
jgi:hypothetical protein